MDDIIGTIFDSLDDSRREQRIIERELKQGHISAMRKKELTDRYEILTDRRREDLILLRTLLFFTAFGGACMFVARNFGKNKRQPLPIPPA